jgi:hypothetical protein
VFNVIFETDSSLQEAQEARRWGQIADPLPQGHIACDIREMEVLA